MKTAKKTRDARLFIVDDHPVFRLGLMGLISDCGNWEVCGCVSTARQAIAKIERLRPTLALVELSLPDESGLELIKEIKTRAPSTKVLVISIHEEMFYAGRALRCGAQGYVMKTEEPAVILEAIRQILRGQIYVSRRISNRMLKGLGEKKEPRSAPGKLSDRELEILMLLGQGKGTQVMAKSLHLSPKTVDAHRGNIKTKLKLNSATELVCYAARWIDSQQVSWLK